MDISQPGFPLTPPLPPGTTLELEGALRALDARPPNGQTTTRTSFQTELQKDSRCALAGHASRARPAARAADLRLLAGGTAHRGHCSAAAGTRSTWLDELNLDPRHRAIAALGTQVVQTQQEQLMASAWEQLGEIERINQMRRQAQLGRAVNGVYHTRHFTRFSDETLLKVVALGAIARRRRAPTDANNAQRCCRKGLRNRPSRTEPSPRRCAGSPARAAISARFQHAGAPPIAIVAKLNTTIRSSRCKNRSRFGDAQPGSERGRGASPTQLKQTVRFERMSQRARYRAAARQFHHCRPRALPKRSLLDFTRGAADNAERRRFERGESAPAYLNVPASLRPLLPSQAPMNCSCRHQRRAAAERQSREDHHRARTGFARHRRRALSRRRSARTDPRCA